MRHLFVVFVSVFIFSCSAFAKQEKYTKHKVEKGETVTQIAKKYKVTPFDIYKLNPDAQNGLKENAIVLIPNQSSDGGRIKTKKEKEVLTTHEVAPKETLFGIAKKYTVSVESLEKANTGILKDGLKIGQTLLIPNKENIKTDLKGKKEQFVLHEVLSKETKYGIAKKYGITIQELEKQNPEIINGLPLGFRLKIPIKDMNSINYTVIEEENLSDIQIQKLEKEENSTDFTSYEVKPKETLYGLIKQFNISEYELFALNPELKNGLKEGMMLKIPTVTNIVNTDIFDEEILTPKEYKDLTSKIHSKEKKELVLLLPFNASKADMKTESKMLNMTLDFYSGALMAIDSARTLGLNVNIRIFDSEESKNTSSVARVISLNNFSNVDVVIGPFYQSNVETTASLLRRYDIPVISPMSKESSNLYSNLYQSVPTPDDLKLTMLNYLKSKDGNVIAIVDPKKGSVRKFISDNYPSVRFVPISADGLVTPENLKNMLLKEKKNYVILETERAGLILNTTNILLKELPAYEIKLVTLEKNNSFEHDEISSSRLMKLNLHYPSMSRDVDLPEINFFANAYKKKNNVYPNQYATRGFDVTFDVLVRLSQRKSFVDTVDDVATEQVGSRFEYHKKSLGGYVNKGVYILYYNDDLTIKYAN